MGDRKNYLMSVELAMKREMAYREKIKAKQGASNSSSTNTSSNENSLPFQVLPQSQYIEPRTAISPLQRPPSGQTSVPIKNSTALLSVRPIFYPTPIPYFGPREVHPPRQRPQYAGQIIGPAPPVRTLNRGPHPRPGAPRHAHHHHQKIKLRHQPPELGDYSCNVCQVECNSEINLRMHLKGHKHKAMLRGAKSKNVVSGGEPKFCELCRIWCPDEYGFRLHLNGKNHALKLYASEKKSNL